MMLRCHPVPKLQEFGVTGLSVNKISLKSVLPYKTPKFHNLFFYHAILFLYLSTSSNSFLFMIVMSSSTDCYLMYKIEIYT